MKRNDIIEELWRSAFIDDVVHTLTSGNERYVDDLKSELFLILCEMPEKKILKAYDEKWINYMCINILKKQYHSSSSPFHYKFRKDPSSDGLENGMIDIEDEDSDSDRDLIMKIEWIIDNKLDIVDRELFKMYFKIGRYDRWIGDLRDKGCQKPQSSYRKMQDKLAMRGEPRITISRSTISISHQRAIMIIKRELKKYERI